VWRSIAPGVADLASGPKDISASAQSEYQESDWPKDGRALSFALKLRNKNSGTNHTQTAKNAATSMKAGASSLPCPLPYRYFGPLYRLASWAFAAKWKNHVKWSATTRIQERMKRGEMREMKGHVEEKFER